MPIIVPSNPGTTSITPSSLSDLKTRIALELHRSDLTTQIAQAISSAITKYQSKRFEFAEEVDTFNTVASQQSYTNGDTGFPTSIGQIDSVMLTQSGRKLALLPITYQELVETATLTNLTGRPYKYAWYARSLWFYPTPDQAYTITISHQLRNTPPTGDADATTVWTNECEPLIRACAKKLIARDVLYDDALAERCANAEAEAFASLMGDSIQLQDDGSGMTGSW